MTSDKRQFTFHDYAFTTFMYHQLVRTTLFQHFQHFFCDLTHDSVVVIRLWDPSRNNPVVTVISNASVITCRRKTFFFLNLETRMKLFKGGLPLFLLKLAIKHMPAHSCSVLKFYSIHQGESSCIICITAPNMD